MLSQTTEYALRAMAWLAVQGEELTPTSVLAQKTQTPSFYLSKVLQELAAAGLVEGRRGVRGGYRLAKPAEEISLLDVINTVAEVKRITSCPLGLSNHGTELCPLHRRADQAAKAVQDVYGGVTLADLLNDSTSSKPLCDEEATAKLTISPDALKR